jgi:hypothetical protein
MDVYFESYIMACRSLTPASMLRKLSRDRSVKIRARVAENPAAPYAVLQCLHQDPSAEVRAAVALNPETPAHLLWALALDEHPDVRFSMADNANTPLPIIAWLTHDENPYVAQRALKMLAALNTDESLYSTGGQIMSAKQIERSLRRMLNSKERLTKADADRLKDLILADGYLSRSERKVVRHAMENDLLDEPAFEIFLDLLLKKYGNEEAERAIA